MKKYLSPVLLTLMVAWSCTSETSKEPVDYVNPYIGNISHMLVPTFPTIQLPNSLMRIYPTRSDFTSEMLDGLPVIVTNHRERSAFRISVTQDEHLSPIIATNWDHEHITPYSYDVQIADNTIDVSMAVSHKSAIYEFRFLNPEKPATVVLYSDGGEMERFGENAIFVQGYQQISRNMRIFMHGFFNQQPTQCGVLRDGEITDEAKAEGRRVAVAFRFPAGTESLRLTYGVSLISTENADQNIHHDSNLRRHIKSNAPKGQGGYYDLEAMKQYGREVWNKALSAIKVEGGTEDQKSVLYTSFYRTMERPVCLSESNGQYFSGFDGKVHEDSGVPFYTDDWIWDTYRAAHPLRALLRPQEEEAIIASYLRMAEQMGTCWMPTFPEMTGDTRRMNSNHGVAMVADALYKGLNVDAEKAFEYCRRGIEEKTLAPWSGNPAGWIDEFYKEKGYIPALREGEAETDPNVSGFEKRQPVAVTLGTAYDQWCLSRIASFLGRTEEAKEYNKKGYSYQTLWNPETHFFHPVDKDGEFLPNFDYRFGGGIGARDAYDENNGWTYRWDVQHNFAHLAQLMGGREEMVKNLDRTFAEPMGRGKREFYEQLPDQTGNIGQFTMANEPSLHIPYIYNYAGAPWKTQKRIRQCLDTWFRNDLMGIPGDEDGGGLTSFVVFSSLGFYPVTPGFPVYNIGSPLFEKISLRLPNGKTFTIEAPDCSAENKYIQSATLNGQNWDKPWFTHDELIQGGTLRLKMGPLPNKEWGAAEGAEPPSALTQQ